ncbi:DUF2281 domain-containing protein [Meiothermus granaticius]|uniref:DUF2281 domain-containing protein n=2 Tax=Meiothermus TaxID=65551 RepID=A0A399FCG0_9DEIN|nr:DUF2281 domain-containing protein [Meiothermus granaticius]RIH92692.1 hypothetical protein Mgrana_01354 [Meiothermus granaticius NBRC 107808]
MTLDEKIYQQVQGLPQSLQEELLDFVQFLRMKAEQREKQEWFDFSLSSALKDMDNEPALYSLTDIKVAFE